MPESSRDRTPADGRPQIQALVLGAVVIALIAGAVWVSHRHARIASLVQGVPGAHAELALQPAVVGPETVTLRWSPVPGATTYQIELLDDSMTPMGSPRVVTDTVFVLRRAVDLQGVAGGAEVSWRVAARSGSVIVSESTTERFALP